MDKQPKKEEILKLPQHQHPLWEHYVNSTFWRAGLLARKSLNQHVRCVDFKVSLGLATTLAGIQLNEISNKTKWKALLDELYAKSLLGQLLNASQHWTVVTFRCHDDYHSFVNNFVKLFELQMAANSLLPDEYTKAFDSEEFGEILLENPIVGFVLAIFLGGPLSQGELEKITVKRTTE